MAQRIYAILQTETGPGVNMVDIVERERVVRLHITHLPEGVYLATSEDVQGLVAQGRTVAETVEIARDVANKLILQSSQIFH
jgi:hypothetical protein